MWRVFALALAPLLLAASSGVVQDQKIEITVTGGKEDAKNTPFIVPLEVPPGWAKGTIVNVTNTGGDKGFIGQLTAPGLITEAIKLKDKSRVRRDLHVVIPDLKAGKTVTYAVTSFSGGGEFFGFDWKESKGEYTELWRDHKQPVFRYMYRAYDNSSEANRNKTYKVFHHLFDPSGTRLVTNGGEADPDSAGKKILYPHHRGLMFAFNKITYGEGKGTTVDTWHAKPEDTHECHAGFLSAEAGMVLGRHRVAIDWHGKNNEVFAKEEREMTVYYVPGGTLLEFASRLKTTGGKVRLDGDPQHAGFQFRAHNDVADKTAKQTYYLRPDGKGKPGETRNWDPKNKGPVNLPWDAMCFLLDGKRYTVAYIDHPNNPGEKRYSERDYGRFGCYFEYDLTPEHPLVLNHRIWLQNGEMTGEQVEALSRNFAAPPKVAVK